MIGPGTTPQSRSTRQRPVAAVADSLMLAGERLSRQVYWSVPWLRSAAKRWRAGRQPPAQRVVRTDLKTYLREIGLVDGALVMAHTSVSGLVLSDSDDSQTGRGLVAAAAQLVDDLLELVGPSGTLVMPSHAVYQSKNEDAEPPEETRPQRYDPRRTPCDVGLANELFWRRPGVLRSHHPRNTLAACGPCASELMQDNLNDRKPLAHGVDSGYYRFCQKNGLVVSVGIPLGRYMTLVHVAEDVRDEQWRVRDFFVDRKYLVRIGEEDRLCVVRMVRPEYSKFCLCMRKVVRDLLVEGILHEGSCQGVRVDWARADEVLDYMMRRNRRSSYPYFLTSLVWKHWQRLA